MRIVLSIFLLSLLAALAIRIKARNPAAAVAVLVGGLLAGMPLILYLGRSAAPPTVEEMVRPDVAVAHQLAVVVKERISGAGTILILQDELPDPEPTMQALPDARVDAVRQVLGPGFRVVSVDTVGTGGPEINRDSGLPARTTSDYRSLLAEYEPPVAILCFSGLPRDLESLPSLGAPVFAVLEDVLPPEWETRLPPGMAALVTVNPVGYGTPLEKDAELEEIFNAWYRLTRSSP